MAKIEDFILRFRVQGEQSVKNISGTIQNLSDDIASFGSGAGSFSNTIGQITGKLGPLGLAAGAAGAAFVALGASALRIAGELSDIAGATGIAAGQLQNFKASVIEAGGRADDFGQIAAKLNQSVQEAAGGNEKLQQAFRTLGVYVTDTNGKVRNSGDILADLTAKFQAGELSGAQYAAAIDILGKNINKLELGKLAALRDPVADADIKRLDQYNEAIDRVRARLEKGIVSFFGSVAEQADKAFKAMDEYERKVQGAEERLNAKGLTSRAVSRPGEPLGQPIGSTGLPEWMQRRMTAEEKAFYEQQKRYAEQEKLMSAYKTRAQSDSTGAGGFGVTPEATLKAVAASEKRIADIKIESARAAALEANTVEFTSKMQGADKIQQAELRYQQDLAAIKINLEKDIQKSVQDVKEQERLNDAQKTSEIEAKKVELTAKAEDAKAKLRQRRQDELAREAEAAKKEKERLDDIITRSKAVVEEQQKLNDLSEKKNKFLQDNVTATDRERQNAEALFNLEEERLKVLKQISQIKDLPPEERVAREKEINDEFAKRRDLTVKQQAADQALSQNFSAGFEKAYRQYSEDSKNAFNAAGKVFNKITSEMEDAFVNFAKTGKFEWKNFVSSMLEELLRSQIKQLMAGLFGNVSSGGNFVSTLGSLLGFANGGVIPTNGPVMVGERGPEILSGVAGRVVTPNNQLGGGSVTYNISAVDAMSFKQMIARDPSFIHAVASQGARTIPGRR